jgi:hypothetical protein
VLAVQQRACRPASERAPEVLVLERVPEPVLEVQQQAQGPVQEELARGEPQARARAAVREQGAERAPEGQAQEARGLQARAEQVAPQEVLLLAGACPESALPDRRLRYLATLGLRQAASRRVWVMPLPQLPLPAKDFVTTDFLRLNGRRLSTANVN